MIDYKKLTSELLKVLRGENSQSNINRKMNFGHNQMSRWESGKNQISWLDFMDLLDILNIDLKEAFYKYFHYTKDLRDYAAIIELTLGTLSVGQVSKDLQLARSTIYGWKNKERVPPVYQIFRMLNYSNASLEAFIMVITQGKMLHSIEETHNYKSSLNQLCLEYPMVVAVALCFDLVDYKKLDEHQTGFLAQKLDIDIEEEEFYIELLEDNGFIWKEDGIYKIDTKHFTLQGNALEQMKLRTFWLEQASDRYRKIATYPSQKKTVPYAVIIFQGDRKLYEEMMERVRKFHNDIMALATSMADNQKDRLKNIYCLNLGLFDLADDPYKFAQVQVKE